MNAKPGGTYSNHCILGGRVKERKPVLASLNVAHNWCVPVGVLEVAVRCVSLITRDGFTVCRNMSGAL
jgi:hypothetical protein